MCPEYGMEPPPTVLRIAVTSKRNIKRINQDDSVLSMPTSLVNKTARFNIFAGNY